MPKARSCENVRASLMAGAKVSTPLRSPASSVSMIGLKDASQFSLRWPTIGRISTVRRACSKRCCTNESSQFIPANAPVPPSGGRSGSHLRRSRRPAK